MTRTALITGITGQDGSYLTELLLSQGYRVHGLTRTLAAPQVLQLRQTLAPYDHADRDVALHAVDYTDNPGLSELIVALRPDEIYNLAAQSHVGNSFKDPVTTLDINARVALIVLEAARTLQSSGHETRVYQAASSELFGAPTSYPQDEQTPFHPRSPYACAKAYAFHQVVNYREAYGLFACNGILFNHESPRRAPSYVTRKITLAAARIAEGLQQELTLGNLDVGRDWGFAKEYVQAMWRMLQQDQPEDFVIATNQWHPLTDFLALAFEHVGLNWQNFVHTDPALVRPAEVTRLQGDYSKAERLLGWRPETQLADLVAMMVEADLDRIRQQLPATSVVDLAV